jgi:hypothetical protein
MRSGLLRRLKPGNFTFSNGTPLPNGYLTVLDAVALLTEAMYAKTPVPAAVKSARGNNTTLSFGLNPGEGIAPKQFARQP